MFKIQNVLFSEIMKYVSHFPLTEPNNYNFKVTTISVSHSFFIIFCLFSFCMVISEKKQYMKNTYIMYLKIPSFIHRVHTL